MHLLVIYWRFNGVFLCVVWIKRLRVYSLVKVFVSLGLCEGLKLFFLLHFLHR